MEMLTAKSDEELRQEEVLIRAWIRDVTRSKRSRLRAIRRELMAREQGNRGKGDSANLGGT
jgi:hypothetical protein